ncbi:MAG: STAS domain-containing protein [Deltaproteobacteria bacterium]|nr:STAS domain-containing protein [Deltaproteobacteria bacterium]
MSVIEQGKSVVRVRPEPGLVASAAEELKPRLLEAVRSGAVEVVFDLEGTDQIDSLGIGLLIATHNTVTPKGGRVRVVGTSPDVARLLKSMRLDRHLALEQGPDGSG